MVYLILKYSRLCAVYKRRGRASTDVVVRMLSGESSSQGSQSSRAVYRGCKGAGNDVTNRREKLFPKNSLLAAARFFLYERGFMGVAYRSSLGDASHRRLRCCHWDTIQLSPKITQHIVLLAPSPANSADIDSLLRGTYTEMLRGIYFTRAAKQFPYFTSPYRPITFKMVAHCSYLSD